MSNKKNLSFLVILFFVSITTTSLIMLKGQTSVEKGNKNVKPTPKQESIEDIKNTFPTVQYSDSSILNEQRIASGKKYNGQGVLDPSSTEDNREVLFVDWESSLSALPVEKSQIVVVGCLVQAQAFLSEDKTSVYSEFKIEISNVLKNTGKKELKQSENISVQRLGGIVEYASGFKTWFLVSGQRMPTVGKKYVFFITNNFPISGASEKDFYLLTAYELREGRVFPLDNPGGGTHPIATIYTGKEESFLLKDLQKALKESTNDLPK